MNFNNLKNFDVNKIVNIVKNNYDKDAGLFTIVLILIIFFGVRQFVQPALSTFAANMAKVNQKKAELKSFEDREKFMLSPNAQKTKQNLPIKIYKAPYAGMDTESASVELVQEVIKIIKDSGNSRISQIDFTTQKLKDDAGTDSNDYSSLSLNMSLEGTYESLKKALNEIYLMNYLVVIKKVNCIPLSSNNYDSIKTDLTLDIYLKLNVSDTASTDPMAPNIPMSSGGQF